VRPTLWDSFGISVAEALHFNVPVIASNVCQRPERAVTFAVGDGKGFVRKMRSVLVEQINWPLIDKQP